MSKKRLALTWFNDDKALVPLADGGYEWVERNDPRVTEVRLLTERERVGQVTGTPADNLLIIGDAYDALHALTAIPEYAEQYKGRVKLVYIDPPFNTEQAFEQYDDNFDHSIWLTMFRDRVNRLMELLREDGSIWVHLDDAEVHRARMVLDEVLGIKNFVAEVVWEKADSPNNSAQFLSKDQDMILVYAKDKSVWRPNRLPRSAAVDVIYGNPDDDPRGRWYPGDPFANKPYSLGLYTVIGPTGRRFKPPKGRFWRISEEKFWEFDRDNRIFWGPDRSARPSIKRFLEEVEGLTPRTLWRHKDVGSNRTSKNEMRYLFPDLPSFATPKPERLMQRILQMATEPDDVVVDCFGGSGTTAAVAHKMGRRWVTVESVGSTVDQYLLPRLRKVIDGSDEGGITFVKEREVEFELPEGMTVEQVDHARKLIEQLREIGAIELDADVAESLARQLRSKPSNTRLWSGGGGLRVLSVAPSNTVVVGNRVLLRENIENLGQFVAAQIGFALAPGRRGVTGIRQRDVLIVVEGIVDKRQVEYAVSLLEDDETVTIAGLAIHPEAASALAGARMGSRLVKIPTGFYKQSRVVR